MAQFLHITITQLRYDEKMIQNRTFSHFLTSTSLAICGQVFSEVNRIRDCEKYDQGISDQRLFASNAVTSVIILGLITIFLFKEGIEFFGQYRHELDHYRRSGMEYANVVTAQHDDQTLLYRYLENILSKETEHLETLEQGSKEAVSAEEEK